MENTDKDQQLMAKINPLEDRPLTKRERRRLAKLEKQKKRTKIARSGLFKKWFIRIILILLIGFGGYKLWQWIDTPQGGDTKYNIFSIKADDWVKGDPSAKVTIIEYADFECPACKIYSTDILPKLENEFPGDLREVYRHFPLPQHTLALEAAKAAEAAGKQGKFWEMHDLLYEKQEDWVSGKINEKLSSYAVSIGLDKAQFEKDLNSAAVLESIKNDETEAYSLRINATPTFYVNGIPVDMTNGPEGLEQAITNIINSND